MTLFPFLKLSRFRRRGCESLEYYGGVRFLNAERLRAALMRERMRADRTGGMFSFITFQASHEVLAALTEQLAVRLRLTDDMGRCPDGVGVLLPETPRHSAERLASALRERIAGGRQLTWTISVYPMRDEDDVAPQAKVSEELTPANEQTVSAASTAGDSLQLFVRPLPRWKRACDIVAASIGLLLTAPLLLTAMVAIRLTSRGPAIFHQWRTGLGGRPFRIYKLRTMVVDAELQKSELRAMSEQDGPAFKIKNDPRITTVGKYLRKTCIDELPQLCNVLRGDMTLVGPRPLPCDETDACSNWQRQRLDVTPGLTCTWQVRSGRSRIAFADWMRLDIQYIRGRNLRQDMRLVWKTFVAVVMHRASH